MTTFDDPNREAVGLEPIWTATDDNTPKATGATAGIPGTWTPAGTDPPPTAAEANQWGVRATPATAWTTGQHVQGETPGAPGEMTWTGTAWVGGRAPLADDAAFDPGQHTVAEVNDYLAEHPDDADRVLAAEAAGKARVSIIGEQ